jgi:hypothetical protein
LNAQGLLAGVQRHGRGHRSPGLPPARRRHRDGRINGGALLEIERAAARAGHPVFNRVNPGSLDIDQIVHPIARVGEADILAALGTPLGLDAAHGRKVFRLDGSRNRPGRRRARVGSLKRRPPLGDSTVPESVHRKIIINACVQAVKGAGRVAQNLETVVKLVGGDAVADKITQRVRGGSPGSHDGSGILRRYEVQ